MCSSITTPAVLLSPSSGKLSNQGTIQLTEQQVPVYTVLLGSQIVLPWFGPHVPSVEYTGAALSTALMDSERKDSG